MCDNQRGDRRVPTRPLYEPTTAPVTREDYNKLTTLQHRQTILSRSQAVYVSCWPVPIPLALFGSSRLFVSRVYTGSWRIDVNSLLTLRLSDIQIEAIWFRLPR